MHMLRLWKASFFLTIPLLLTTCMVGPDFHRPKNLAIDAYTGTNDPKHTVKTKGLSTGGRAQSIDRRNELPGEWWRLFHSAKINRLIRQGLENSPNLAAAKANLLNAQETLNAQIGSTMLPNVNAGLGGQRQLSFSNPTNPLASSGIFNVFNANVNVGYTLDLFGGLRRQIEAVKAQVDFEAFQLEAAYLTLTTNIVTTAITIGSLKAQIDATKDLIKEQKKELRILKAQFDLGGIAKTAILQQETLVAQNEAALPILRKQMAINKHALSVLVGETPDDGDWLDFDLNELTLPSHLPLSIPSALVRQRPDIRAAEATMHTASANIGVAVANMYPQITLNGTYGWEALTFPDLFTTSSNLWSYGANITQAIFNGESLMAKKRAAIALYQNAYALYKQTVLQAFQNVADTLRALQRDAENLRALRAAELSSRESVRLAEAQYQLGGANYLSILTTMLQYQQARLQRITAEANRYTDTAALYQALGGGWWKRPCLDCSAALNRNVAQYQP